MTSRRTRTGPPLIEHHGTDVWTSLLFARGGLSWFGGFAGGVLAGLFVLRRRRLPLMATIAAATPALAIGHAIGRIGCLLVGDDYGIPTDLPWGIAFPEGLPPTDVPVHPTMIYESIALLPIAAVLFCMRTRGAGDHSVVGAYLVMTALTRFLIQWIRVYEPFAGPARIRARCGARGGERRSVRGDHLRLHRSSRCGALQRPEWMNTHPDPGNRDQANTARRSCCGSRSRRCPRRTSPVCRRGFPRCRRRHPGAVSLPRTAALRAARLDRPRAVMPQR